MYQVPTYNKAAREYSSNTYVQFQSAFKEKKRYFRLKALCVLVVCVCLYWNKNLYTGDRGTPNIAPEGGRDLLSHPCLRGGCCMPKEPGMGGLN